MDLWWQRAKTLRTGTSEVKCLSCHTAVPYLLARAKLRDAAGEATPTAHERRILEIVRARVAYGEDDQPYYDHTEDKKVESRGVEAVVNAFVLTSQASSTLEPDAATRAAIARLWQVQRADGAWDWLNFGLEPYEAPGAVFHGATLAALAAGTEQGRRASSGAAGQAGVAKLRVYVREQYASQHLFNRTWALIASSRFDGILPDAERRTLLADLRSRQRADGGWSLADLGPWRWTAQTAPFAPPGSVDAALLSAPDGYATGLVVYALRQAGAGLDDEVVRRGQAWLRTHQAPARADDPAWSPWRTHSLNFDRENGGPKGEPWRRLFMSDLATAFGALGLL